MRAKCWLREVLGPAIGECEGPLQKAHLIPKQTIRRELRLERPRAKWQDGTKAQRRAWAIVWDGRVYRPACSLHHHRLDVSRTVRIPRERLPAATEAYAEEHGLGWWLTREYGPREAAG